MENILPVNSAAQVNPLLFNVKKSLVNKALPQQLELEFYDESNKKYFEMYNREWVEKYFEVEEEDTKYFSHPKELIVDKGGEVFFVKLKGKVIGTCAMIRRGKNAELSKLGVTEKARGLGAGQFLMEAALDWARKNKIPMVYLVTNSILSPALGLYKKNGFKITHQGPHPDYERGDLVLEKVLQS